MSPLPNSTHSPVYTPNHWNAPNIMNTNNCYSYSMNISTNQLNHNAPWGPPGFRPQPGILSNMNIEMNGSNIVHCVREDMRMLGRHFYSVDNPYDNIRQHYYRVFLVFYMIYPPVPVANGFVCNSLMHDYHWYIQNRQQPQQQSFWSHKPGLTAVINTSAGGNLLTDPHRVQHGIYNTIIGFFEVSTNVIIGANDGGNDEPAPNPDPGPAINQGQRELSDFKQLEKHASYEKVTEKLGQPDYQLGSGFTIIGYDWFDSANNKKYIVSLNFRDNKNGLEYMTLIDEEKNHIWLD